MPTTAERRRFAEELRREMNRLRADAVYVVFGWTGPYQHNPYDTPLPLADHPRVYRALYEAVDYAKDVRHHGWNRTKISRFERADVEEALAARGKRPIPSEVIWRSTDVERDARKSRRSIRTRRDPRHPLRSGDLATVDGQRVVVRQYFPQGSSSYLFPHYKVDFVRGDRNVAVSVDRVHPYGGKRF